MMVLAQPPTSQLRSSPLLRIANRRQLSKHLTHVNVSLHKAAIFSIRSTCTSCSHLLRFSRFRVRSFPQDDAGQLGGRSTSGGMHGHDEFSNPLRVEKEKFNGQSGSFLAKLAILLGIAATITIMSVAINKPVAGSSTGIQFLASDSASSVKTVSSGFSFKAFGYKVVLPQYAPGWIYFWLLMAAGCGLFISEEALNIWVGISLSRLLTLDGTWQSFVESFSRNAPYIISTILWVYWGVCISDMVPFYVGRIFKQSGASNDICAKLGIGKDKLVNISQAVKRYGNLSGFVERFSLGVRNPTAFLAGVMGISPDCFFAGVCFGGLITLPVQLGIGFLLRERPVFAVATVATAVGIWTLFPYIVAASTALFFLLRKRNST